MSEQRWGGPSPGCGAGGGSSLSGRRLGRLAAGRPLQGGWGGLYLAPRAPPEGSRALTAAGVLCGGRRAGSGAALGAGPPAGWGCRARDLCAEPGVCVYALGEGSGGQGGCAQRRGYKKQMKGGRGGGSFAAAHLTSGFFTGG